MKKLFYFGVTWLCLSRTCVGQPGTLDPSFGTNGIVHTDFNAYGMALQTDGKLLVGGFFIDRRGTHAARYNVDGSADLSFNNSITNYLLGRVFSVDIYSGKIVLGGDISGLAAAKLNTDGTIDLSFGLSGVADSHLGNNFTTCMCIQPDGKIIVAGTAKDYMTNPPTEIFGLARFNPNGTLDNTFNANGTVTTRIPGKGAELNAMALQSDGKIVVTGLVVTNKSKNNQPLKMFATVRYNTDGTLDNSFKGGIVVTPVGDQGEAFSIAVQKDGKILVGGNTGSYTPVNGTLKFDWALVRYNPDGSEDLSFGNNGMQLPNTPSFYGSLSCLAIQTDGRIVMGGQTLVNNATEGAIMRFNGDGSIDPTFGTGGKVITNFGDKWDDGIQKLIISGNKLYAAGTSTIAAYLVN